MKESKVRFHPSCDIMKGKIKTTAAENKQALKNQNCEWFVFDEISKNGRNAMLKGITPMDSTTIALLVGPMNTSNLKAIKGTVIFT